MHQMKKQPNQQDSHTKTLNQFELLMQPAYPPIKNKKRIKKRRIQEEIPPFIIKHSKSKNQISHSNGYSLPANTISSDTQASNLVQKHKLKVYINNPQLQTLNIQFQHKFGSLQSTCALKTANQLFRPSQSNFHLRKMMGRNIQDKQPLLKLVTVKDQSQQKGNCFNRDSQSLLRKNSLYLLNFLKTKHRDRSQLKPEDMPFLTQLQMKNLQDKEYYQRYYQSYRKTQISRLKERQSYQVKIKKTREQRPLIPQPW